MRVLHVLSQRPSLTGSGVTLEAFVRHAASDGCEQRAVIGVPADDPRPGVGGLPDSQIHPLVFDSEALPFPVPGMSDVMPYRSTRFSSLGDADVERYLAAWRAHIGPIIASFRPDIIHSHHVWLLSSVLPEIAPGVPVVTSCHATGLRQMRLCPQLKPRVVAGCSRIGRFLVLHHDHERELRDTLVLSDEPDRVRVIGAGYREDVFHPRGRDDEAAARSLPPSLVYAGKYSHSKGLPQLLDAVELLRERWPGLILRVAGTGAGEEAEALRTRMKALSPTVVLHGQVDQPRLAELMRGADVFVLPSFYEGLPLVLVEALACGCRPVCTRLSGVEEELAPRLGSLLELVDLPRLVGPDVPHPDDLPAFVDRLARSLDRALTLPRLVEAPSALREFRWRAVYERVAATWRELTAQ